MNRFEGRHVVVTGGGRGIGAAIAERFTHDGARVTIVGRGVEALAAQVAAGGASGYAVADVTDAEALSVALGEAAERRGPVEVLVANAGGVVTAPFHKTSAAQFEAMFRLNVLGVVHAVQAVLPGMKARGAGRIVAVASTASLKGYPYVSAYCAAKHAVLGLVRALAVENAKSGVTVNAVCPGYADTEMVAASVEAVRQRTGKDPAEIIARLTDGNPQGRLVRPAEVADAVAWLAGPEAGAINGQAIAVAGGEVM